MQNLKNLLFIYNPHSGKAMVNSNLGNIISCFSQAGYLTTVYPTMGPGDASRVISQLHPGQYDRIICSGGDGTVNEIVNGFMSYKAKNNIDAPIELGYIPAGSTNDFASSLGIPKTITEAAEISVSGEDFCCDIGRFNEKFFIYVAAFGIFTDVSYDTDQGLKNVLGHAAYVIEAIKRISNVDIYNLNIECDNQSLSGDFVFGIICNAESIGGIKGLTGRNVHMDDGKFECLFIKDKVPPEQLVEFFNGLVVGNVRTSEFIHYFKTKKINITSNSNIDWTLDGEFGGTHNKVSIENIPQMLKIKIPSLQ